MYHSLIKKPHRSLKTEFTKPVLMFIIQIAITIFAGYFYIMGDYFISALLCICLAGVYDHKGKEDDANLPRCVSVRWFKMIVGYQPKRS